MPKFMKLESIENASVIRKFSVVFSLISLLPFLLLVALLYIFLSKGAIKINSDIFFWSVFLTGVLSFVGFLLMRRTLSLIIKATRAAKEIAKGDTSKRIDLGKYGDNEITQLAYTFNEVVQKLENNIRQLEKSRNTIQVVLLKVASGVSSIENTDSFLGLILETTVKALDGNIGMLLLINEEANDLTVKSSYGLNVEYFQNKKIPMDDEVVGWVIKQKKPLLIPRMQNVSGEAKASGFEPPLICAPLVFQNKVVGAISVSGKKQETHFSEDELVILSNLASQVALALENSRLNASNLKAYIDTISALAMAVEARDEYSRGHSDRVCGYAVRIAEKLKLDQQRIRAIKEAAQLHDVGKIGISDEILRKQGMLNDDERGLMQQHPVIGEGIILPLHGFSHLRDPIRHHHEWLNGEGYPDNLKGESISLESKILTVADSFDAMTTDRPYRKGMNLEQAKEELLKYKGIHYDPSVVDALINSLNPAPAANLP